MFWPKYVKTEIVKNIIPPIAAKGITGLPTIIFIKRPNKVLLYPETTFCRSRLNSAAPIVIETKNADRIRPIPPGI